jgi:hypothetical protein
MVFNERIDKELAICWAVFLGYSSYLLRTAVIYQNQFFAYWFSLVDNRRVSIPQSKNCPTLLGIFQTKSGRFQSIVTTGAPHGC